VSRLRLELSPDSRTIQKVTLEEPSGDRSEISFSNIRVNGTVSPSEFSVGN
jgi:hypothetical protein